MCILTAILTKKKHLKKRNTAIKLEMVQVLQAADGREGRDS